MNFLAPFLLIGTIVTIFIPSISVFFSADDWFHLRITQIHSIGEFFNFFSFSHTAQSAAFWRPLSTQVFFFIFQKLFSQNVWPYHFFVLACFGYSLYLIKKFSSQYLRPEIGNLTTIIYGLSVSNFTRIYFLSAFQEIVLVIFSLLCLLNFPKSKIKATVFFILALMSKETAIVLPLIVILLNLKDIKKTFFSLIPISSLLLLYLFFRFMVFGSPVGDSYLWNFSPAKAINTLMWYVLWSFGAPELLVDYVGSGLKLVPKFFIDYPIWWKVIIPLLLGTVTSAGLLLVQKVKEINWLFVRWLLFFLITVLPVIFLPSHKFALELGLPLVGFSLAIAWLIPPKLNLVSLLFLAFYIFLNLTMNYLTYTRHYSVSRGEVSRKVYNFISKNYTVSPNGKYFEFINDSANYGHEWGQSKQISQAIGGSEMFRVIFADPNYNVYYKDYPGIRPGGSIITLSTQTFLP